MKNLDGKLVDVTLDVCPELNQIGLVSALVWTDFDSDGKLDFIITGEWMPVRFFRQEVVDGKTRFKEVTQTFGPSAAKGWWTTIFPTDLNGDGKMEYLLGNYGTNIRWKATPTKPFKLVAKDFDQNQSIDPIYFHYTIDDYFPVAGRDALVSQIPSWKNKFLIYSQYANYGIDAFFDRVDLSDTLSLEAHTFTTSYLKQDSTGRFQLHSLPIEAQLAPVFAFARDKDELVMAGNFFGNESISGRYDALKGVHISLDGGELKVNSISDSGFFVPGEARAMATLKHGSGLNLILVSQHNGKLLVFRKKE